jgi:D-alanyl-D-alanine carboxypeptidase
VTINGHDHLLDWYPGADGIKTGYIHASGFNLATSAVRDGHRLIGVVLGGTSGGARDREMAALLDQGFASLGVPSTEFVAHRAVPVPQQAPTIAALPSRPVIAAADPPQAPPPSPAHAKPGLFSKAAARLAAHLSPVGKAEAATFRPEPQRSTVAAERWGVQFGDFRAPQAATKAARDAATLPAAKGKPVQIVTPGGKDHLYRARLLNLTPREAQGACAELRKKNIPCSVISPSTPRIASR